ncbi:LIM and SH3 domain protein F42H10.3 isoform X2 [Lepeophtheirus salmonis]|uniref:LIM and SH3 domain protein F42H10.3 isoform X2 n=2 Tax=Lepeophtheirus salmonis TaxID=72036 RepID=UPI001AE93A9C|nr:LIM and SH3 domain protein F42H10.3-like isoform X2 [Lepeophtheirus salmonis]
MNVVKKCAKCEKTVYPIEEVKCLEKVWHKACFKCQTCNMTLSMKNYKGFEKLPYCNAHIPKAKATIVADTPEMKRLAENSKNQSNVKYHAEFEASKGKFTAIADDPEIQRIKANTQTISNISYHGIVEQKAAQERMRNLNEENCAPPPLNRDNVQNNNAKSSYTTPEVYTQEQQDSKSVPQQTKMHPTTIHQAAIKKVDTSRSSHGRQTPKEQDAYTTGGRRGVQQQQQPHQQPHQVIYDNNRRPAAHLPNHSHHQQQQQSLYGIHAEDPYQQRQSDAKQKSNKCYQALYDYDAQDLDEVSFVDGDLIINCSHVDEGWMTGTVHRTGKSGMLPANYVQRVNL